MNKNNIYLITRTCCAVLLIAGLFAGCGRETQEVTSTTQDITVTETTTEITTTLPATTKPHIPESDSEFVKISDYAPTIKQDLRYATTNNFTNKVIYKFDEAYLRYGTLKKLIAVHEALAEYGVGICVWDAFRPVEAQQDLWNACPNPTYVSNPASGASPHCKGNTVDITLFDLKTGTLLEMPTEFDDFSTKAYREYADDSKEARKNVKLLEEVMEKNGFTPYYYEWWHYQDETDYDVEYDFSPEDVKKEEKNQTNTTTEKITTQADTTVIATVAAYDTIPTK